MNKLDETDALFLVVASAIMLMLGMPPPAVAWMFVGQILIMLFFFNVIEISDD